MSYSAVPQTVEEHQHSNSKSGVRTAIDILRINRDQPRLSGGDDRNDDDDDLSEFEDDNAEEENERSAFAKFYDTFLRILNPLEVVLLGIALFLEVLRGVGPPLAFLAVGALVNALYELDEESIIERVESSGFLFAGLTVAAPVVLFTRHFLTGYVCHAVQIKYEKAFVYFLSRAPMSWLDNQGDDGTNAWLDLCGYGFERAAIKGGFSVAAGSSSVIACLCIVFTISWQLGLVTILTATICVFFFIAGQRLLIEATHGFEKSFASAGKAFQATMRNIVVVYAFSLQDTVAANMAEKLGVIEKAEGRRRNNTYLVQGMLSAVVMLVTGATFWYSGTYLVKEEVKLIVRSVPPPRANLILVYSMGR